MFGETFEKISRRRAMSSKRRYEVAERRGQAQLRASYNGCVKIAYASKSEAEQAMGRFNSLALPTQLTYAYRCLRCQAWHLTSQEKRSKLERGPCGQVVHRDKQAAINMIETINASRAEGRPPIRGVFFCQVCNGYHHSRSRFKGSHVPLVVVRGPCGRVVNKDEVVALAQIDTINADRPAPSTHVRSVYYCPQCDGYHHSLKAPEPLKA